MGLELWKSEINNFIPQLLEGEANEKNAILLASLIALNQHFRRMDEESTIKDKNVPRTEEYDTTTKEADSQWILDMIQEELADSEKYYNKFLETGIVEYKNISADELRHSEFGIKRARETGVPDNELQDFLVLHGILMAKLI